MSSTHPYKRTIPHDSPFYNCLPPGPSSWSGLYETSHPSVATYLNQRTIPIPDPWHPYPVNQTNAAHVVLHSLAALVLVYRPDHPHHGVFWPQEYGAKMEVAQRIFGLAGTCNVPWFTPCPRHLPTRFARLLLLTFLWFRPRRSAHPSPQRKDFRFSRFPRRNRHLHLIPSHPPPPPLILYARNPLRQSLQAPLLPWLSQPLLDPQSPERVRPCCQAGEAEASGEGEQDPRELEEGRGA